MSESADTSDPRVAVLVLNYDGRERLEAYLPSLVDLDYVNYRVYVVDNASTDDSVAFVRESFPSVSVVEHPENYGISRGLNEGVRALPDGEDFDYLWLLNNDVKAAPDSLSRLVAHLKSRREVGVAFPRINDMGTETIQSLGQHYDVFAHSPPMDRGLETPSDPEPREVPFNIGAAILISRAAWEATGGYDSGNFVYGCDTYLCLQSWLRGYHVETVPTAVVYHEPGDKIVDSTMDAFHTARSDTRVHLTTLSAGSLAKGFAGFCGLIAAAAAKDVLVRRRPELARARFAGLASAFKDLPTVLRNRRRVQRERVYPDERFLSPVTGKRGLW
ncbi:glycosyltransferase family 2 protein [Halomarina litorea]|uniref:glycosyltransferase family 2 protein n=1 Tax=Halomarina litorea TaxID=2961595 RepID=UPI0020C3AB5F|nr:glycosyltransferase family 2 protein [Halomarina sp. BCD28]